MSYYVSTMTLDGVEVEITHSDAGREPDGTGMLLNTTAVWFKPKNGAWKRSRHRSAIATAHDISNMNSYELNLLDADRKPEITKPHEEQKGGDTATTARPRPRK